MSGSAAIDDALIEALQDPTDPGAEEAWNVEIQRRIEEMESGAVQGIRWSDVRARLFREV